MVRAFCALLSAGPRSQDLGGSPLHKQIGLAGGGGKLGHRPEEFRSLGRLSASELCSLPMVPAAVAAEERRDRRSPLQRWGDRAGTGTETGMLRRGWAPQGDRGVRVVRPAHVGNTIGGGWGCLIWGTARLRASRPPSFRGNPKRGGGERPASAVPATGGRRRFHSLAHTPQAGSFRDADWWRRLRAAVSSGLEGHRLLPEGGRVDTSRPLGQRPLKGPDRLKTRPAPKGWPFPIVMMRHL